MTDEMKSLECRGVSVEEHVDGKVTLTLSDGVSRTAFVRMESGQAEFIARMLTEAAAKAKAVT